MPLLLKVWSARWLQMTCPTLLVSRNTKTTFTGRIGASAASSVLTKPAGRTARSSRAIWITSWTSWCFTRHVREAGTPVPPPTAIARTCAWLCLSAATCAAARRITRSTMTTRPAAVSSIRTPIVLAPVHLHSYRCWSLGVSQCQSIQERIILSMVWRMAWRLGLALL